MIDDQSVQLVVTSPPYWQLKDYGTTDQLGFHDSYETYINNLNLVWSECHRILENGCRLCVNIGDQFARAASYGRYKVIPIRTEIIKFCEAIGFDYMGAIIWQKKTTTNTSGGGSLMGSYPNPRNGVISIDYEFILLFKKQGRPKKVDRDTKASSSMTKEEWKKYFSGHWNFGGTRQKDHIAMFPEELPHRLIKMFSFVGETVFDPFLGSGTTSLAANKIGRNSIGYEINPDFISIIQDKIGSYKSNDYNIEVTTAIDNIFSNNLERQAKLPYKFIDFHQMAPKVDLKNKQYGSVIDKKKAPKEIYYSVKEIISPNEIILNDEQKIILIGIKTNPEKLQEAIEFLKLKTNGQRVYIRTDSSLDPDNNLRYLYLKNKTFINRHLIKHGLAHVETSYDYKNLKKFEKLIKDNNNNNI